MAPTSQLESCSSNLRRYDRDSQCKSGSTKRIPKRVRLRVSRTSRTDEAAEPHRLGSLHRDRLKKARKDALWHFIFARQNANLPRIHAQNDAFGHPIIRDLLVDPSSGLPRLRPRKFRYKRSRLPPVLVWSDARWEASDERPAGMGFVVFFPETPDQARAATDAMAGRRPPWLLGAETPRGTWRYAAYDPDSSVYAHWRAREQYIGQLEFGVAGRRQRILFAA